ncbi:porin family protein [Brumicola nitratireducens]|uniref:Putative outer membrane protein n=1 Tax=Glaciecola nitratireducens (strain JCM 12485 / KCTC 12276 / FR1064) TaxID=1085623 RepID=G4QIX3_GLANF|nr:porin family protein [Glaciecola nitratireducens]AEP28312.1 putative outer membrane protein [Glaciecola nitratireducens FR1064]
MKKLLPLAITILTSSYAATANAEDSFYIGALYNVQEISADRDLNTAGIVAGYRYNQYFALETRLAKGTSGYSFYFETPQYDGGYEEDIDSQISLSIKASYPIFESFQVYGLVGFTKTELEINATGPRLNSEGDFFEVLPYGFTESESGLSYGIGVDYQINEQFNIFIDYQILPDFEPQANFSSSWKSTTIGFSYSF